MKRLLAILLCLALMLAFMSACGTATKENKENQTGTTAAGTTAATTAKEEVPEPITFTMHQSIPSDLINLTEEQPITKLVREKTGVTVERQFPVGESKQQIALMCAANEYPDFIFTDNQIQVLYDAGALLKLDDLVEQYGPNIKALYGESGWKSARWSLGDMSHYFFPTEPVYPPDPVETYYGQMIQLDALKEAGFPQIKTLTDYENVIKQYVDKHPTYEGKPTLGLSVCYDGWHSLFSLINPLAFTVGDPSNDSHYRVDPKTYDCTYRYTLPEFKEAFRWVNHMNAIGLLDPESFVQKFDQYTAKISSGRVVAIMDVADWHVLTAVNALRDEKLYGKLYGCVTPVLKDGIKYRYGTTRPLATLRSGIVITKSCKDPVRAVKFFDWLCSDEGQKIVNWGIEGLTYEIKDGKKVIPDAIKNEMADDYNGFAKRTGKEVFGWPWPHRSQGEVDANGELYITSTESDIEIRLQRQPDIEKEALKAYGVRFWYDLVPPLEDSPYNTWGQGYQIALPADSPEAVIETKLDAIKDKRIPEAILSKPGDFDTVWAKFEQELKDAGVAQAEAAKADAIRRAVRLYNE